MQRVLYILFASTVILAAIASSFFYLYESDHYTGGFSGVGGQNPNDFPVTASIVTVTKVETITVASVYSGGQPQSISQNNSVTTQVTTSYVPVTSTSACQAISGQVNCEEVYSSAYVAFIRNQSASGCAYNQVVPYRINGTIFAYWVKIDNATNIQNYFKLQFKHFTQDFQNGTTFWHYDGAVPLNFTTFSLLGNSSVLINTNALATQFNPCLPTSLMVMPGS